MSIPTLSISFSVIGPKQQSYAVGESKRYEESKIRMEKIVTNLKAKKHVLNVNDLIRMYESDGITPDYLKELEVIPEIPPTFYSKLSDLHQAVDTKQKEKLPLKNTAETELLFYGDDPREFEAKVLGYIAFR